MTIWSVMADNTCMRLIAFIEITVVCTRPPSTSVDAWSFCFRPLTRRTGPIVRIAPNELHVADVEYYDTLYALGVKRDKVPYMIDIFGTTLASLSIPACTFRELSHGDLQSSERSNMSFIDREGWPSTHSSPSDQLLALNRSSKARLVRCATTSVPARTAGRTSNYAMP